MSYLIGRTGLILREWVERGRWKLNNKTVYVKRAESVEYNDYIGSTEYTHEAIKFPTVFKAHMFVRRYEAGQMDRCRQMYKEVKQ